MQGLGFLLKSALLLAGVSSKVSYWLESLSVSFNKFSSRKERFCWVSIFCLIEFMLCDHRAMAIEDYGFLLSNPKSPPSLSLYQKKTENQEKSDSRGRKSDFFSGFENQWTLLLWEPKSDLLGCFFSVCWSMDHIFDRSIGIKQSKICSDCSLFCLPRACSTSKSSCLGNGIFTLQEEWNNSPRLHEFHDLIKDMCSSFSFESGFELTNSFIVLEEFVVSCPTFSFFKNSKAILHKTFNYLIANPLANTIGLKNNKSLLFHNFFNLINKYLYHTHLISKKPLKSIEMLFCFFYCFLWWFRYAKLVF